MNVHLKRNPLELNGKLSGKRVLGSALAASGTSVAKPKSCVEGSCHALCLSHANLCSNGSFSITITKTV